jgi:hypothetical protein
MLIRVLVQGVTREPSDEDPDGGGFYTARDVEAQTPEHATEIAFASVRKDRRSFENAPSGILRLLVDQLFTIDGEDAKANHGYVYYDGGEE